MSDTTDPNDPRLGHGSNDEPVPQNEAYLVLSEDERKKGFVRPVRTKYLHVGIPGPTYPLRDLDADELDRFSGVGYVKFEAYPEEHASTGKYWTQEQLDSVGKGCGAVTSMSQSIAETYAAKPHFYGSTYCVGCGKHRPVGPQGEFVWDRPREDTPLGMQDRVGS